MNLRTQMLLAGALTLAVPIIGWQSVKQLDHSLRQTRIDAQSLTVANARLALAESDQLRQVLQLSRETARDSDLYAERAKYPLFVDGYQDDWQNLTAPPVRIRNEHNQLKYRAATRDNRLYLFFEISDSNVVFHQPPVLRTDLAEGEYIDEQEVLVNGDAIEILIQNSRDQLEHILFRSVAPGPLTGVTASRSQHFPRLGESQSRYKGFWINDNDGFQLEISLPLPEISSTIGFAFIDVDANSAAREHWTGTMSPDAMRKLSQSNSGGLDGRLFYASDIADQRLQPWVTRGTRARLYDKQGRLLSDINSLYEKTDEEYEFDPAEGGLFNAILFRLFAYFVADDEVLSQPFQTSAGLDLPMDDVSQLKFGDGIQDSLTRHYISIDNDRVLGTLVPVGGDNLSGYLLFESNEDLATAYSGSRVARLFSLLTLVSLLAGIVLLAYASILSIRIRNLSRLAHKAVADDGRVRGLPHSEARDEIGDLSRNLSSLLTRTSNYNQYLEALSGRLSHELRTPLSVVKTSIENMDRDRLDSETITLMDRASGGADQLNAIIRALVESTRLEQTVQQAQKHMVDIVEWFGGAVERYQQIYPRIRIATQVSKSIRHGELLTQASPELLQQALDKLVDNAVSFAEDQLVTLVLDKREQDDGTVITIAVANNGPKLDEGARTQLFDPMFSQRNQADTDLHLGLGLYIVRIIAQAHQGKAWAKNAPNGVVVGMHIPALSVRQ